MRPAVAAKASIVQIAGERIRDQTSLDLGALTDGSVPRAIQTRSEAKVVRPRARRVHLNPKQAP